MSKKKIILLVTAGVLVLAAAGTYTGVGYYYSKHFYNGTSINGIDASGLTVEEVKDAIQEKVLEYGLTIKEREGQEERISAGDIGLAYADDGRAVEEMLSAQNPYLWITHMGKGAAEHMAVNTTYKAENIPNLVDKLNCVDPGKTIEPKDAFMEESDSGYRVVPEVVGNKVKKDELQALVIKAIDGGEAEISIEEQGLYIVPVVYSDDTALNKEVEELNRLTSANIVYDFVDRTFEADRDVIKGFLIKDETGSTVVDPNQVTAWVNRMARDTDTFGLNRSFRTSLGDVIELSGGDYGWAMNVDSTAATLLEQIQAGAVTTLEADYVFAAMDRSSDDIGDTYVEVSIENQRMWCYENGELIVDTPIVTGNESRGWGTPKGGCWAIDAKKRQAILKGEGYEAPVDYWLPFNGDVGIHDLNRTEFGGEIYKTSGSHGCVNTPYDNVEKIYEAVEIGTPVIVW